MEAQYKLIHHFWTDGPSHLREYQKFSEMERKWFVVHTAPNYQEMITFLEEHNLPIVVHSNHLHTN